VPESEADLQLAHERLAALNASLWAIDHHVELAQIASTSDDTADLEAQLLRRFGFNPDECNWVTSQPVIRLTRSYRATIENQIDETTKYLAGEF
jgi:DNA gyrase/topoisomerase IV subunit A